MSDYEMHMMAPDKDSSNDKLSSDASTLKIDPIKAVKVVEELQDFALWMTGCGHNFSDSDFFVAKRDALLSKTAEELLCL